MTSGKRDRMAAAVCTRAVQSALDDDGIPAMTSTTLTSRRGYWAVTIVKPTDDGYSGGLVVQTIANSYRVPAREVKIESSWFGNTVKVWWKG